MRVTKREGALSVRAIAGTHVVLMALDCAESKLAGLMGFAVKRQIGDVPVQDWLKALKVFRSLEPAPKRGAEYSTAEHPIQSFLWSDYTAQPDTQYTYTVTAMYGRPGALTQGDSISFTVKTEKTDDGKHGIWFNRGALASQSFAREFDTQRLTEAVANNPRDRMTAWLSRGLLEACLDYVGNTRPREGLRVCAYEFTYPPLLNALKSALADGVDVQIIYHKTPENDSAIEAAGIPAEQGGKKVLFGRWKTKIPHDKFILRLDAKGEPVSVWTGSTNFTASGFLGQTNVGHLLSDATVAKTYLGLWQGLSSDPAPAAARDKAMALSPNPPNAPAKGTTVVLSPRLSDRMLDWYAQRIADARTSAMLSGAFGVSPKILGALEQKSPSVRFALLERPPDADLAMAEQEQRDELLIAYGSPLGYESKSTPAGGRTFVPIARFPLDDWFLREELSRPSRQGFVFFLHTKFLLIDPLADDPLVCTGTANLSAGSLIENDEIMLHIRGDTRVADIYLTEFDRIFRHFHFRNVADDLAMRGRDSTAVFLDESGSWVKSFFEPGSFDCRRREMFFADPKKSWAQQASADPNPFAGEKAAPLPLEPTAPPKRVIPVKPPPVVKEAPKPPPPPPKPALPPPVRALPKPPTLPPVPARPLDKPAAKVPPKPPAPPAAAVKAAAAGAKPPAPPIGVPTKPQAKPGTTAKPPGKPAGPAIAPAAMIGPMLPPVAGSQQPPAKQNPVPPAPKVAAKPAASPTGGKPAATPPAPAAGKQAAAGSATAAKAAAPKAAPAAAVKQAVAKPAPAAPKSEPARPAKAAASAAKPPAAAAKPAAKSAAKPGTAAKAGAARPAVGKVAAGKAPPSKTPAAAPAKSAGAAKTPKTVAAPRAVPAKPAATKSKSSGAKVPVPASGKQSKAPATGRAVRPAAKQASKTAPRSAAKAPSRPAAKAQVPARKAKSKPSPAKDKRSSKPAAKRSGR